MLGGIYEVSQWMMLADEREAFSASIAANPKAIKTPP